MRFKSLADLYTHELQDLYNAEKQLEKALPKVVKKATDEGLKRALEDHLEETHKQCERLEQIFDDLDESPKGEVCEAMRGLIAESEQILKATGDVTTIDAAIIAMGNRMEHYEMAGYGAARTHAELLGHEKHAGLLQETLDEEGAANKALMDLAKDLNVEALHD